MTVTAFQLPQLKIGPVEIGFPAVQAALSGYSDLAMRVIARRLGASYAVNEVVLDQFLLTKSRKQKTQLAVADDEHPVGGQLMGANPDEFGPAAKVLAAAGYDVIDINFGCPVKKVLGRCRGGFLLSQPRTALEIVSRVREHVPPHIPVSVKMRRGMDDSAESRDNFFEIFDGAFERGVAAVTVHGRTVVQRYVGPSRWSFLLDLKRQHPHRTILGSGDLFTAEDCLAMLRETGVDGVTVARGAIGNPWIFAQIRALAEGREAPPPPSLFEQREVLREHFRLAVELYGDELAGRQMRKFGIKYSRLHPEQLAVRQAFVAVRNLADWTEVLDRWYSQDLPGVWPSMSDIDEVEC
jgi:tRNA-dihydrouridine synthase B